MKKWIAMVWVIASLPTSFDLYAQSHITYLGANYNESADEISAAFLKTNKMPWFRTFIHLPQFLRFSSDGKVLDVNTDKINSWPGIDSIIAASNVRVNGEELKLILSFKFNFKFREMGTPALGSEEYKIVRNAVRIFLDTKGLGEKVDILVLGNEPMWETPDGEENLLYDFTNAIIERAEFWKNDRGWKYDIYVGALNRVNELRNNPVRQKIMQIAKENPLVKGLDIHSHAIDMAEGIDDVRHIRQDENFSKEIILTEFSLHRLWVEKKDEKLGNWGANNGYSAEMKMYEWINIVLQRAANGNPVSDQHYMSYFNSRSWYPKGWFGDFFEAFNQYRVHVATYGITRTIQKPVFQLNENKPLWVLNAAYNQALFGDDEATVYRMNPMLKNDFLIARNAAYASPGDIFDLSLEETDCQVVSLTWSDMEAEDGYRIRRKITGEATYTNIMDVGRNVTSYTDSDLDPHTDYTYMVRPLVEGKAVAISNTPEIQTGSCVITSVRNFGDTHLKVFPNPTNSYLNLSQNATWQLQAPGGMIVREGKGNRADISDLQPGVYFLISEYGVKRIVKVR